MDEGSENNAILGLTAQIVAAHAAHNDVPAGDLPGLIRAVHAALLGRVGAPAVSAESSVPAARPAPAVPPGESVFPDYIICLEDGRQLKMLRRHLMNAYGLTPEQYRIRWDLPPDYPMVAPNYAARRSALARESGLGTKGRNRD
jgi:predicted transcriptional regulator